MGRYQEALELCQAMDNYMLYIAEVIHEKSYFASGVEDYHLSDGYIVHPTSREWIIFLKNF